MTDLTEEAAALDAYSRIVVSVAEKLAPSVANLRVMGRGRGGYTTIGAGSAIVLTADAPRAGRHERDLRTGFAVPADVTVPAVAAAVGDDRPVKPFAMRAISLAVAQKCNLGCTYCYAQGGDFGGPDETMLSEQYDRPVLVHRYPAAIKPFYMKPDPERAEVALGVDVLGVVQPGAVQAVAATRNGRVGLLATPVVGTAGASILLGEPITLTLICAMALIIGGIAIGTLIEAKSR